MIKIKPNKMKRIIDKIYITQLIHSLGNYAYNKNNFLKK